MAGTKKERQDYLIGKIFNRLTVVDFDKWYIKSNGNRISKWICKCLCGNIKSITGTSLNQGLTQSCGCLNKETSSISGQKYAKKESGFYDLYRSYKNKSKFNFELTIEEFRQLTSKNCYYCNCKPYQIRKKISKINSFSEDYIYNGVDRINSNLGYEINNCVPSCGICNKMKNNLTEREFINHIINIVQFYKLKE